MHMQARANIYVLKTMTRLARGCAADVLDLDGLFARIRYLSFLTTLGLRLALFAGATSKLTPSTFVRVGSIKEAFVVFHANVQIIQRVDALITPNKSIPEFLQSFDSRFGPPYKSALPRQVRQRKNSISLTRV